MTSDLFEHAINSANLAWEIAIEHLGWSALVVLIAYLVAAWLSFVCGYAARQAGENGRGWYLCCGLLLLLTVESVLQSHVFLLQMIRSLAKAQGWYADRRSGQYYLVAASLIFALLTLFWLRSRLAEIWHDCAPAVLGIGISAAVFLMRAISFHDTDQIINFNIVGISLGRLLEMSGLLLIALGARRWLSSR
jgi:hypothetical protein